MTIKFSEKALELMQERGIEKEDVEKVVEEAEKNNVKIISDDGSNLCRSKVGNYTVYAQYEVDGDVATVVSSYSNRVNLVRQMEN